MKIAYEDKNFIFDKPVEKNRKYYRNSFLFSIKYLPRTIKMMVYKPPRERFERWKGYRVSICTIFKNEAPYLKEWIEYNFLIGVDHIYLFNNNSTDDYMSILEPYIADGRVSLENWSTNHAQLECYKHCVEEHRNETLWLGFIDLDEFIVPIKSDTIYDFLKQFNSKPAVIIYWKFFCTSGLVDRDIHRLVINDFNICFPKYVNIGKIFYNTAYDFVPEYRFNKYFHHYMWAGYKGHMLPPVNAFGKMCAYGKHPIPYGKSISDFPIQINHYFSKSLKEYSEKCSKGDVYFKTNPHDIEYLEAHEKKCTGTDYSIYKYVLRLKMIMKHE